MQKKKLNTRDENMCSNVSFREMILSCFRSTASEGV